MDYYLKRELLRNINFSITKVAWKVNHFKMSSIHEGYNNLIIQESSFRKYEFDAACGPSFEWITQILT